MEEVDIIVDKIYENKTEFVSVIDKYKKKKKNKNKKAIFVYLAIALGITLYVVMNKLMSRK